jgi:translation elongation factor P/translation initiation factor 5A
MKSDKSVVKTVKGPKAAIAGFKRVRDGQQIWVFARPGESNEKAIVRVKKHNGSSEVDHVIVNQ